MDAVVKATQAITATTEKYFGGTMTDSTTNYSMHDNITTTSSPTYVSTVTQFPNVNVTDLPPAHNRDPCLWIFIEDIGDTGVRIWDLMLLVPNALFLLFLLVYIQRAREKLKTTNSPMFATFYIMVWTVAVVGVIRCIVSMTVSATSTAGSITDKVLWLIFKFFLLCTELSVLIFGVAFGNLDSRSSLKRVLTSTAFFSLLYSITQAVMELVYPDQKLHIPDELKAYYVHGGMMFLFVSSLGFFLAYTVVLILPLTSLRNRWPLPAKKSFYWYIGILALLNLMQAVGSLMAYCLVNAGICVVDITTYLYFAFYAPWVYWTFLSDIFGTIQPKVMFSYKSQADEAEETNEVRLPHSPSFKEARRDNNVDIVNTEYMSDISTEFTGENSFLHVQDYTYPTELSINTDPSSAPQI